MSPLSLYELNSLVRGVIASELDREYWVEAELAQVNESRGNCYLELVQMPEHGARTPVARASAKCWKSTWVLLRPHFERATGQCLRAGLRVLLRVYAQFHEAYGFSWIVTDINPEYTLGDMQRKRQEIIRQLKDEGIFDLQRELTMPLFAQRVAVISSATAAGYGDFSHHLNNNRHGYRFHTDLFAAIMQGELVEQSVIAALDQINRHAADYDVVVIIRGGGATADLSGFDTLLLAENVANFPLPIITGIGHDRDESILDLVAHTSVKTPTAVADLLIERLRSVEQRIDDAQEYMVQQISNILAYERMRLSKITEQLPLHFSMVCKQHDNWLQRQLTRVTMAVRERVTDEHHRVEQLYATFPVASERLLTENRHRLKLLEEQVRLNDPQRLLSRGYSITFHHGHVVRDPSVVRPGDAVETRMEKGVLYATVTSVSDNNGESL